jgi:cobalt-zinc-cadmium efflux system outer membrane protein
MTRVRVACSCVCFTWLVLPQPGWGQVVIREKSDISRPDPSDEALTLGEAVAAARVRAPRSAAARERVAAARAAIAPAGRWPNPIAEWRMENLQSSDDPLAPLNDTFATVSQPIELGGKPAARRRLAESEAASVEADAARFDRDLVLSVAEAYLAAVRARRLTELLGSQRQNGSEVIALMKRRVDEGFAPEADLRKFEAEVARVDANLLRAWLDLGRACAVLGARIGAPGDVEPAQLADPAIAPPPAGDFPRLAADLVERRPEVVAAQRRLGAARAALDVERNRRWPDPVVTGGYKRTAGFDTGLVGVGVPVPIGDRNGVAIARAAGEERAAVFDLEAARREAQAEIEAELRAAAALAERAQQIESDFLVPADIVRRAARSAFREGGGDVLHLVDAERVFIDSQREALDLRLDAVMAGIRARLAMGQEIAP